MSRAIKIVAIVLGVLVLIGIGILGVGWYWWSKHGRVMLESGHAGQGEGQAYGQTTDEEGCVSKAVERYSLNQGLAGVFPATMFLAGCLQTSDVTPEFCDDVPRESDWTAGKTYGQQRCREAGVTDEYCPALFKLVQKHCEPDMTDPDDQETGEDEMMPEDEGGIEEPTAKDA